ncbi:hypothetical protein Hanom_Chr04g00343971 [Helianthus anomalus]
MAAQAPTGYITLFWDYFDEGNFQLPVIRFVLNIIGYYKFHISQLHPMGMLHCSQGFYSFAQRPTTKKILLVLPKSFHEWKPKFFYIKAGVIPVKMSFRGAKNILAVTLKTSASEIWYWDIKKVRSVELREKALVAARLSLHWEAGCHDKLVYVEDDKIVSLYVVAYKREKGKMATMHKGADEETWYHQIVTNFALPKDADLNAQPSAGVGELINLGVGPESKKKNRGPVTSTISKKVDAPKADILKEEKKKGTRLVSKPWCDYVVLSDTLEDLAPVAVKKPKPEPRDTADIPVSNPDDPIDGESSPEPFVSPKAVKRKQPEGEATAQPTKKITRKKISKKAI